MKNENIIGRVEECNSLNECMQQNSAQLILVYGRRRVGKTYLINEYFDYQFAFKLTGAYNNQKNISYALSQLS